MGNPRGQKRDFEALERRRLQAAELFGKGLNNSEIGRQLNVPNQTISRWRSQFDRGGAAALAKAGRAGRKPALSASQLYQLLTVLRRGPEAYGYATPLWTCDRVSHAIQQEFNVEYHPGHVWKILRRLNWPAQPPASRVLERNDSAEI